LPVFPKNDLHGGFESRTVGIDELPGTEKLLVDAAGSNKNEQKEEQCDQPDPVPVGAGVRHQSHAFTTCIAIHHNMSRKM